MKRYSRAARAVNISKTELQALIKHNAVKIRNATTGIVLLGTPHRGTDDVTSTQLLERITRAGARAEASSLAALQRENEMILDTVKDFATMSRENHIATHCFFEQKRSLVSKMFGDNFKVRIRKGRDTIYS